MELPTASVASPKLSGALLSHRHRSFRRVQTWLPAGSCASGQEAKTSASPEPHAVTSLVRRHSRTPGPRAPQQSYSTREAPSQGPAGVRAAKPASGSHVCRPCRHLPASPGASLAPTPSSFSKLPHLFHREKLKKRKDQVPIQKVRDASSQVVLRHLAGGKERLFAKTLLTAPRGGQAPHCACAVVVPPQRAADNGGGCALWALRPLQAFWVGLKHCTK